MGIDQVYILIIACVVATACALPGVYLVLRKVALMSDAISHAILLGIVVFYWFLQDLHSPFLVLGAVITGLLTVILTELIISSNRLKKDAAIGLVFPVFFSIGVIMINLLSRNVHLDQDAVLLGEIGFAPFNTWMVAGHNLGPISLWVMGSILIVNILFVGFFYKELKLSTFDSALSFSLGFSPVVLHYSLMTLVSLTAVGAFDAVGSILVVALMITPPSTAYLLTKRLSRMIALSVLFGLMSAILGFFTADLLNVSISGSMATLSGLLFLVALFFSPSQGLLQKYMRHKYQRVLFSSHMLLVQLLSHEGTSTEEAENSIPNMIHHMGWTASFVKQVIRFASQKELIVRDGVLLRLTPLGREKARSLMIQT